MKSIATARTQGGALMIEILVTIIVVVIGALGIMQMQGRLQKSEMEAYQRTQAMIMLNDMASRISSNRSNAASYVTGGLDPAFLGGTTDDLTCTTLAASPATVQSNDAVEWCQILQGAGERQSGTRVGAVIGGRGCVQAVGADQFMVTVAWQGMTPTTAPPASVTCAANQYNVADTDCINDLCRRYVTTLVTFADLDT